MSLVRLALVALTDPEGVVTARRVAREAAAALAFPAQEQTRIATAVSELARNAHQHARGGRLSVAVEDGRLVCCVEDDGPGMADVEAARDGLPAAGGGLVGVQRLVGDLELRSGPGGTVATISKPLPEPDRLDVDALRQLLHRRIATDAQEELEHQNRELLEALAALEVRTDELVALNAELDETNRGVVALHHELDQQAQRDRTVSRLLQRSLMPERLVSVPGAEITAAHRSAGEGSLVGGDFYDVVTLDDSELWLVMGDVAGHGVETAAKASELRQALRLYAREGYAAPEAVERLNRLVLGDGLVDLVTLCLVCLRPADGAAEVLLAGHPPPLLVVPGDAARLLEGDRGPILGVPDTAWGTSAYTLAAGSRVVLYTDGLVERVGEPIDVGLSRLTSLGGELTGDGATVVDQLFALLEDGPLRDDVAILTARLGG